MTYQEEAASGSNNVWFGIEWSESNAATTFSITPKIYRWDRQNTDNSGGRWSEDLTEPSGSTGSWSGLKFGSGSGYRVIDTFAKRTYTKTHSARTITYHLRTDANFGTYYNGWTTLGAQTWTFTMTVPAKASYAVTYYNNGGGTAPSAQTKWYGEDLTLNGAITNRTNYVFKNWNTKADGTGTAYAASAKYTGNAALTLYAQWYAPYTITPNANGGTLKSGCSALTKVHNTAKAIWASSQNPTRTGYTFTGWNTKADGTGTSYAAGANYTANANSTLYAQWRINTWAVTYDGNGSTGGSTAAQTKTYGQSLTLRQNGFTRTNYNFVKWNTAANGSGTSYNAGASYTGNAALKLYAQWEIAHGSPTISAFTVKRCTPDGTESVEGDRMKVEAQWSVDNTTEGFEDTVGATFKVTLGSTTDTVNLSGTSGTVSFVHSATAAIGTSYKVTSVLADSKGFETTRTSTLSVAYFTMHFKAGGTGVGIGKPSTEDNLLDVGVETRFNALATVQATTASSVAYDSGNPKIRFSNENASQNGDLVFTDYDAIHTGATLAWITDQPQSWFHTQHIKATGSITSGGTIMAGQSENITSTVINDASVATSSNTGITNRLDYAGNGTQVGYSQIIRTSSGMYRSFAVTNPKTSKTTSIYLFANDNGTQSISFTSGVALDAANGGTGRAMTTANRTYWCGRIIYDNNSGSSGNIKVSETFANFAFVLIGFKENDGYYDGMFVGSPNGKTVILHTTESTVNGANNSKWQTRTLSGTACNVSHYSDNNTTANHIYITHIIGFA